MKKLAKVVVWVLLGMILITLIGYAVAVSYKKEILAELNETLKESINGDVQIGDLNISMLHDFPNISLSLKDIYLRGPRYHLYHKDFLRADAIDLNVGALKLLQKEIRIKSIDVTNGEVFIFRTKDGFLNLNVFNKLEKPDTTTSEGTSSSISFDELNFENVSFAFYDSLKEKSFSAKFVKVKNKIVATDSSLHCRLLGSIDFVGLMFNAAKGSFLENKQTEADLNLEFFTNSNRLIIEPSSLALEKSTINLSGALQFLLPGGNFQINIQSDQLDYQEALTVVTEKLRNNLGKFLIDSPVTIDVKLKGDVGASISPSVDVSFAIENSNVSWRNLKLQRTFVNGTFTNHKDSLLAFDDKNSEIKLTDIRGIVKTLPFKGTVAFNNLTDPFLKLNVTFSSNLKRLNAQLDTTNLKFSAGSFTSKVKFAGKLKEYFDDKVTKYHGKLQGETQIKGGKLHYSTKNLTLEDIDAAFVFTESKFDITKMSLLVNENPVSMTGSITGFIPFFLVPEKHGNVSLNISSPSFDFTALASSNVKSESVDKKTASKKKISNLIDSLYQKLEFEVDFKIDKIKTSTISGTDLSGKVLLTNDKLNARNVKMNTAGGSLEFSSTLISLQDEVNPFTLRASVRNADIKDFFLMFNNFKQTTIRSEHIDGKLSADISMTAEINDNFEVLMPRLVGAVTFNVRDGRIRDFAPLENMSNFLFKKRDFTDVQFDEIEASFDIQGTELDIDRMEVQSTVLTLFLEGRYSLKDSTDLSIQVPLSNLKKRDKNFVPENVGTDAKVGLSVYLRAYQDKDGKTVITFDRLGNQKKEKVSKRK